MRATKKDLFFDALLVAGFWAIYFPLLKIVGALFFWHPKLKKRRAFEKKNLSDPQSTSFLSNHIKADVCFEFSSEGEYQQVAPLIEDALKQGKKMELVFFSPSVESSIQKFSSLYPDQIRYLRYPFLSFFPFIKNQSFIHWVSSSELILVRYDFFPEFLIYLMMGKNQLKVLWASFKKERLKGTSPSWWKRKFLKKARLIIYASDFDQDLGNQLGLEGMTFDFRLVQITRRKEKRETKLATHFPIFPRWKTHLESQKKKIILGNVWPSDLFLLKNLPPEVLVVIVPHELNEKILQRFFEELGPLGRDPVVLNELSTTLSVSSTYLINQKGILCELYADFPLAYVGGGFHRSIHSVLEPLAASGAQISCGPLHGRSTEYDLACSLNRIKSVHTPEEFLLWFEESLKILKESGVKNDNIHEMIQHYNNLREQVISC